MYKPVLQEVDGPVISHLTMHKEVSGFANLSPPLI